MAVDCCGESRTSRFCPECGERLSEPSVLDGLLIHCRTTERNMRAEAARMLRTDRDNLASRKTATAERWKAWGDALAAIMSSGE